jgi:hypothetical protein
MVKTCIPADGNHASMTADRRKLLDLISAVVREDDSEATLASLAARAG